MMEGKLQRKFRTAFRRQAKLLCDIDVALSSDGAVLSEILDVGVGPGGWPIGAAVTESSESVQLAKENHGYKKARTHQ
jgi:hypothetical protein